MANLQNAFNHTYSSSVIDFRPRQNATAKTQPIISAAKSDKIVVMLVSCNSSYRPASVCAFLYVQYREHLIAWIVLYTTKAILYQVRQLSFTSYTHQTGLMLFALHYTGITCLCMPGCRNTKQTLLQAIAGNHGALGWSSGNYLLQIAGTSQSGQF